MAFLEHLRSWQRRRKEIARVIARVKSEGDPLAAVAWLDEHPAETEHLVYRAMKMAHGAERWHALLLTIALATCRDPQAVDLVQLLIGDDFDGWKRLDKKALCSLRAYLLDLEKSALLTEVRKRLTHRQRIWSFDVAEPGFAAAFSSVPRGYRDAQIVDHIATFLEDVGLGRREADAEGLRNVSTAAALMWESGQSEEALQLWTSAVVAVPTAPLGPEFLRSIAESLPEWIPTPEMIHIDGHREGDLPSIPVPSRVVRAADLLADFPQRDWIEPLKKAWLSIDNLVRRDTHDTSLERDPECLMAAQSVAAALGTCAALDHGMCVLIPDEAGRRKCFEELAREYEQRGDLVNKLGVLRNNFLSGIDVDEATVIAAAREIGERTDAIRHKRLSLRADMTPAGLLLHVLADEQAYPLEVRQGAAWGLRQILDGGVLEADARDKVQAILHAALQDEEIDEAAVRDQIVAALPQGAGHVREVLAAAERYAVDRDFQELVTNIQRIAPEQAISLAHLVREKVDTSYRSRGRDDFGERLVRVPPAARLLELIGALRRGLRWMVKLVEGHNGKDPVLEDEENLRQVVTLIGSEIPNIMRFLSRYPLRMMTIDRHRHILGEYSRDKVCLKFWTQFTPPRWFRGAKPAEIGQVHQRYVDFDDRSTPNAMGIYYRLFEHPILVLPVLYHEFMHYGGPNGNPKQGICNETEVLMREVYFARHLLAYLAPKNDAELTDYEESIATAIERAEMVGLAQQLFFDFEDDRSLEAISEEIVDTYGAAHKMAAAKMEVEHKLRYWNRMIDFENEMDEAKVEWCPEVDWPRLDTPITQEITVRIRAVLYRILQEDHRLDPIGRDKVLVDPCCICQREDWWAYRERTGALEGFARFSGDVVDKFVLKAIIHRFELEGVPIRSLLAQLWRFYG